VILLMAKVKQIIIACVRLLLIVIVLPLAFLLACIWHRRASRSRLPAVLFGLSPLINNKYWSHALKKLDYTSASFVYNLYAINREEDFDYTPEKIFPRASRNKFFPLVRPYLCFFWGLKNFDIFVLDFDGGFLRGTPLQFLEFPLLALAGRKIIANPYGSDVMDVRRCSDPMFKAAILRDYPMLTEKADEIRRRVLHYCRWASFIICGGVMIDFLPRADLLITSILGIDTNEWRDAGPHVAQRNTASIKILHAPNHTNIKGTDFLVKACEELRAEGLPVELIIKQKVPNQEIKELMRDADIVASAFLTGYYELFAIEGMSLGKPVLNYWRPDLKAIYSTYSFASECPVMDTPVEKIKGNVRKLATNSSLRAQLGEAGRRYVEKYHSHEAIGQTFDKIVREVWYDAKQTDSLRKIRLDQIRSQYPFKNQALSIRELV
jgi:glycosyltransferase involved in cell wall biosynthesis